MATAAAATPKLDTVITRHRFAGVVIAGSVDRRPYVRNSGSPREGADALWRYASVTKQLTALIVMQEAAAGRLALDTPIKAIWPEWPHVFADLVTVRMLLRHDSGLRDPAEDAQDAAGIPHFYRRDAADPVRAASGFCAEHPRAEPGTGYHYDNCDYIVLGALLERITGKSFATLLDERIATPLGARIGLFGFGEPEPRHVRSRGDVPVLLGSYGAAGGAYGTPLALWALDRALLTNRLLPPSETAEMWRGDDALGHSALGALRYSVKLHGCPTPVDIVERRGEIGGVQIRNFLGLATRSAVIAFTARPFVFGDVWSARGFAYELLSAALCPAAGRAKTR